MMKNNNMREATMPESLALAPDEMFIKLFKEKIVDFIVKRIFWFFKFGIVRIFHFKYFTTRYIHTIRPFIPVKIKR